MNLMNDEEENLLGGPGQQNHQNFVTDFEEDIDTVVENNINSSSINLQNQLKQQLTQIAQAQGNSQFNINNNGTSNISSTVASPGLNLNSIQSSLNKLTPGVQTQTNIAGVVATITNSNSNSGIPQSQSSLNGNANIGGGVNNNFSSSADNGSVCKTVPGLSTGSLFCPEALPEHHCQYCGVHSSECVVKCTQCNKWFCNGSGTGKGGSHIVNHLVRSRHATSPQLHPDGPLGGEVGLECYNCGNKNLFVLGFVPQKTDFVVVLICREPCLINQEFKDSAWDLSKWQPLIEDRKLLTWLVREPNEQEKKTAYPIKNHEIIRLEECWRKDPDVKLRDLLAGGPRAELGEINQGNNSNGNAAAAANANLHVRPVTLRYEDAYQYQHTFAPLVKLEADYDKLSREQERADNVTVRFEISTTTKRRLAFFHFTKESTSNDIRVVAGDEIRLRNAQLRVPKLSVTDAYSTSNDQSDGSDDVEWSCEGTVVKITASEEVCLELRVPISSENSPNDSSSTTRSIGPWSVDPPIEVGFTVEFVWKSVSFDRMQTAMRQFAIDETSCSNYIYKRLLGQDPDRNMNDMNSNSQQQYQQFYTGGTMGPDGRIRDSNNYQAPNLPSLNHSQQFAVKKAITSPLQLIQGPPGTGKTVVSATIVWYLVKNAQERCRRNFMTQEQTLAESKVLVCAPSNIACDQLAEKIHKTGLRVVRVIAKTREEMSNAQYSAMGIAGSGSNNNNNSGICNVEYLCLHNQIKFLDIPANQDLQKLQQLRDRSGGELSQTDERRYRNLKSICEKELLRNADVVCCTCVGAGDPRITGGKGKGSQGQNFGGFGGQGKQEKFRFSAVLLDESTQATEPEALIPIMNGCKQLVLVGDHLQLGPVICCSKAAKAGLHQSLFERLVHLNARPIRLDVQYRMHPALSEFPSQSFYDGSLQNGVTLRDRTYGNDPSNQATYGMQPFPWPRHNMPIFFYNSTGGEEISASGTSFLNRSEADQVCRIVSFLLKPQQQINNIPQQGGTNKNGSVTGTGSQAGPQQGYQLSNVVGQKSYVQPHQIGIITPYEGQRSYIMQILQKQGKDVTEKKKMEEIEISSIDAYQGREKDFIVLSCVRSNQDLGIGFLNDPRRLNVALTRAKYGLIICGNAKVLGKSPKFGQTSLWLNLLSHLRRHDLIVEGPLHNLKQVSSANLQLEAPSKWNTMRSEGVFMNNNSGGGNSNSNGTNGGGPSNNYTNGPSNANSNSQQYKQNQKSQNFNQNVNNNYNNSNVGIGNGTGHGGGPGPMSNSNMGNTNTSDSSLVRPPKTYYNANLTTTGAYGAALAGYHYNLNSNKNNGQSINNNGNNINISGYNNGYNGKY